MLPWTQSRTIFDKSMRAFLVFSEIVLVALFAGAIESPATPAADHLL
jgi:hypothetical protein